MCVQHGSVFLQSRDVLGSDDVVLPFWYVCADYCCSSVPEHVFRYPTVQEQCKFSAGIINLRWFKNWARLAQRRTDAVVTESVHLFGFICDEMMSHRLLIRQPETPGQYFHSESPKCDHRIMH